MTATLPPRGTARPPGDRPAVPPGGPEGAVRARRVGPTGAPARVPELGDYPRFLRRHRVALVVLVGLGLLAGLATVAVTPSTYTSSVSVLTPRVPLHAGLNTAVQPREATMDTEAQLVLSGDVLGRLASIDGTDVPTVGRRVTVSVAVNTRVLTIQVRGSTPREARDGADILSDAYLSLRERILASYQQRNLEVLQRRVALLERNLAELPPAGTDHVPVTARTRRQALLQQIRELERRIAALSLQAVQSGDVVRAASLPQVPDARNVEVGVVSCVMLGLLAAILYGLVADRSPRRVRGIADLRRAFGATGYGGTGYGGAGHTGAGFSGRSAGGPAFGGPAFGGPAFGGPAFGGPGTGTPRFGVRASGGMFAGGAGTGVAGGLELADARRRGRVGIPAAYRRLRNLISERDIRAVLVTGRSPGAVSAAARALATACAQSGSVTTLLVVEQPDRAEPENAAGAKATEQAIGGERTGVGPGDPGDPGHPETRPRLYETGTDPDGSATPYALRRVRPAAGMSDRALPAAVDHALRTSDQVVVCGPAPDSADALAVAARTGAVLLVAARGRVTDRVLAADARRLALAGTPILGAVLTSSRPRPPREPVRAERAGRGDSRRAAAARPGTSTAPPAGQTQPLPVPPPTEPFPAGSSPRPSPTESSPTEPSPRRPPTDGETA